MRSETDCRRPEFTEGCKVTLGDGQEWTFPKPVLRLVPVRKEGGGFELKGGPPFGDDYQVDLLRYIGVSSDDETGVDEWFCLRLSLAVKLLTRNYDLSDEDIQGLLYIEQAGSDVNRDMWTEIDGVVLGRAPKPLAVGSDAS